MSTLSQFFVSDSSPDITTKSLSVSFFMVGGGGGGGSVTIAPSPLPSALLGAAGGGGGGAVIVGNSNFRFGVSYPIVIGAGGAEGSEGGHTKFSKYTAFGGGSGGSSSSPTIGNLSGFAPMFSPSGGGGVSQTTPSGGAARVPYCHMKNVQESRRSDPGTFSTVQWSPFVNPTAGCVEIDSSVFLFAGKGSNGNAGGPGSPSPAVYAGGGGGTSGYSNVVLSGQELASGIPGWVGFIGNVVGTNLFRNTPAPPTAAGSGGGAGYFGSPTSYTPAIGGAGAGNGSTSTITSTSGNAGGGGGGGGGAAVTPTIIFSSSSGGGGFISIRYPTAYSAATVTGTTTNPGVYVTPSPPAQIEYYWTGPGTITFN